MSNDETLADILDEMRNPPHKGEGFSRGDLADLADRIEAAAKRERGALVAEAEAAKDARNRVAVMLGVQYAERCRECKAKSGNAAAMRKAVCDLMDEYVHRKCPPEKNCEGCERKCGINDAWLAVSAALAAPTRNCDRYRTEAEAEAAFDRFCAKARDGECKPWECPLKSTGGKYCYVAWLLGTEGGAE